MEPLIIIFAASFLYLALVLIVAGIQHRKKTREMGRERMIARVEDAARQLRSERLSARQHLHLRRIEETIRGCE